ncbi:unnamed protein product [Knipowitschia caucasica]
MVCVVARLVAPLLWSLWLDSGLCFPNGSVTASCGHMLPVHSTFDPSSSPSPYRLWASAATYRPGAHITDLQLVTKARSAAVKLRAAAVEARAAAVEARAAAVEARAAAVEARAAAVEARAAAVEARAAAVEARQLRWRPGQLRWRPGQLRWRPGQLRWRPGQLRWRPGQLRQQPVTLEVKNSSGFFQGFLLQARSNRQTGPVPVGSFQILNSSVFTALSCNNQTRSGVSQADGQMKSRVQVTWEAPDNGNHGDVTFRATVVQSYSQFWVNVSSASVQLERSQGDPSAVSNLM